MCIYIYIYIQLAFGERRAQPRLLGDVGGLAGAFIVSYHVLAHML